jgi:hypothetical protein
MFIFLKKLFFVKKIFFVQINYGHTLKSSKKLKVHVLENFKFESTKKNRTETKKSKNAQKKVGPAQHLPSVCGIR